MITRRKFLTTGLLATLGTLTSLQIDAQENSFQRVVVGLSDEESIDYRLEDRELYLRLDKNEKRLNLRVARKLSAGWMRNLRYCVEITDNEETGLGNLDKVRFEFKDNRDRANRESSEAVIDISNFSDEKLITQLKSLYELAGNFYLGRKSIVYNRDIVEIDRQFREIFEGYRIPISPIERYTIQDVPEQNEGLEGSLVRGLIKEGIEAGMKVGIPR